MSVAMKKKRNQEDTRAKLLDAALDIFSKNGYDAATTRNIAKKAGVNESLIHRYFKSKLGLFLALRQHFRANLTKQFLSYEASENLEEELVRFMKSRLQGTKREKKFLKLAISQAILNPKVREDVQKYANLKPPALVERFDKLRRIGQIRMDADLDQIIDILHLVGFSFSCLIDIIECMPKEGSEKMIRTAVKLLSEGLRPRL